MLRVEELRAATIVEALELVVGGSSDVVDVAVGIVFAACIVLVSLWLLRLKS